MGFKQGSECGRKPTFEFNGETADGGAHTYVSVIQGLSSNMQSIA